MKTKRIYILYVLITALLLPCLFMQAAAGQPSTALTLEDIQSAYDVSAAETAGVPNPASFSIIYTANGNDFTKYDISEMDSFYENDTWYVNYDQLDERMVRFYIGGDYYEFNNGLVRISIPMDAQNKTGFIMNDSESLKARVFCDAHIVFRGDTMYVPIVYILGGIDSCSYLEDGKILYAALITDIAVLFDRYGIKNPYAGQTTNETANVMDLEAPSNQEETANIDLVISKITANSIACTVDTTQWSADTAVKMSISDGSTEVFFRDLEQGATDVECNELASNTAYQIAFTDSTTGQLLEQCGFHTFAGDGKDAIQYIIDISNAENRKNGLVRVSVFGVSAKSSLTFVAFKGHTDGQYTGIIPDCISADENTSFRYEEDEKSLRIQKSENYYAISYTADKSFQAMPSDGHGYQGILSDDYLMVSCEQLLIGLFEPEYKIPLYLSLDLPAQWRSDLGVSTTPIDIVYAYLPTERSWFAPRNIYAYNETAFRWETKQIEGTSVRAIVENGLGDEYPGMIFRIFEKFCEYWGGNPQQDAYTVMIIDDERNIYAGEYDTGQGMSIANDVFGTISHQVFHRWNGWELTMEWADSETWADGWWLEGFNEYSCYKMLTELGLDDSAHKQTRFNMYKESIAAGLDAPILGFDLEDLAYYYKGFVLTYALDQEIMTQTNNAYGIDDILRYLWNDWVENGSPGSYSKMKNYINEIVPDGIDGWWQEFVVDNQPLRAL